MILGIAIAAVLIVGGILAGIVVMNAQGVQLVKDGDYMRYRVVLYSSESPVEGYVNMTISNAGMSGFDMTIVYEGFDIPTETVHFDEIGVLATYDELGEKQVDNPTHNISTVYGLKSVDIYYIFQNNEGWTSYVGTNPLVQYRIDVAGNDYLMLFFLDSTNIEQVKNGNAA